MIDDCLDCLSSTVQMNIQLETTAYTALSGETISDHALVRLGESLSVATKDLEKKSKDSLRHFLRCIHEKAECPINRFCVSGSCGHQPSNAPDDMGFDITVFVDCEALHGQAATSQSEHFECAIQSSEKIYRSIREMVSTCESDHFGIHFKLNEESMHVSVTPSMGTKMHLHRKCVWDLIEGKDRDGSLTQSDLDIMSLSLHESLTAFMHMGDPVFHSLVRLCRLWRRQVLINQGCGELSTLACVLVMMRCIEDEKARGMSVTSPSGRGTKLAEFPVTKVFKDFLETLGDFGNLTISYQRFYEPDMIPERHLGAKPCILDPVNPWRNVVHGMTHEGIEWVKRHAIQSRKILDDPAATVGDLFMLEQSEQRTRGL
jgi:hypothetical protein